MGRIYEHSVTLPDQRRIGYGLLVRDGAWYVRFMGPNNDRLKRTLQLATVDPKKATKKEAQENEQQAHKRAEEVVAQEFRQLLPRQQVTWDEAIEQFKEKFVKKGLRETTMLAYLKDLKLIRDYYKVTTGPADIDESMATTWLDEYAVGKDRRVKGKEKRTHSAHNVKARLGALSALWGKWFLTELGIVKTNPFANLKPPKADKLEVKYVKDDQLEAFFTWLDEFYRGWEFPRLFFSLKAYTGCRLQDICGLMSLQLRDGGVQFAAADTKARKERVVPLPEDLFAGLTTYAGKKHLWENYPGQLKDILKKKGVPTHQLKPGFDPDRLYQWVLNVFKEYKARTGVHLTSHQFRKRAFTLAWKGEVRVQDAAIAFGCNPDTLMKHYVNLDEQATTNAVFGKIGANILGRKDGTQLGHNSAKTAPGSPGEKKG